MKDTSLKGREFVVSTIPFANPGDRVRSVDNVSRALTSGLVTTITAGEWSFLFSVEPGMSELYHLPSDPGQADNLIHQRPELAREMHQFLMKFMHDTNVPEGLIVPRRELLL